MFEVFLRASQQSLVSSGTVAFPVPADQLPFSRWRMQNVRRVLTGDIPAEHMLTWNFLKGDHWQGGWGYAGPVISMDDPSYSRLMAEILKGFVSRNVIREIAKTHINGVLGRPMRWSLVPRRATKDERDDTSDELKTTIAEASAIVRQWLQSQRAHRLLRQYLLDLLIPPGRASLRLFLPVGGGVAIPDSALLSREAGADFAATMAGIFVEKPDVGRARIYTDPDTMRQAGVSLFKTRRGAKGSNLRDAASITFLSPDGRKTIVGTIYEDGTFAGAGYEMGGRLLMHEGERDPLFTQQLLQEQRMLNYAESTIPRTLQTAGFPDRILSSIQLNGKWVIDDDGVERYEVADDDVPRFGPGEMTILQPLVLEDEEGRLTVPSPSYQRTDPIEPTGSIMSSEHFYNNMKREADMGHLVKDEDSDSAIIRYGLSLLESAIPMTEALRWLIETGLALAEAVRGEEGKYTGELRATASCFLNVGQITPEQRASLTAVFEKSLMSRETAQEQMGIEDVDEENDRIAAQPGSAIDLAIRMANSYKMLRDAGMPARLAAIHSGYSEEEADEIAAEQEKEDQKKLQQQEQQIRLEASLAPKPNTGGQSSQNASGLRSKRQGRPSGTRERNPGQQQDKGARALQSKKNNRRSV